MLRSTFSTTTIASSTTMPIASTSPNSDRLFSVNPNIAMKKKVPISDTGIATSGMIAARQVCRNRMMTSTTRSDGLQDRLLDRIDRLLDELGRIVDDVVLDPGREPLRQLVHRPDDALRRGQRIRAGPLEHRERDRRIAIEIGVRPVVLRGELDPRHVLEAHHRGRASVLTTMLANSSRVREAPERLHRDLERALVLRPAAG